MSGITLGRCTCGGYHQSDTECLAEMCEQVRQMKRRLDALEARMDAHTLRTVEVDYVYRPSNTVPLTGTILVGNSLSAATVYPEGGSTGHTLKEGE